MLDFDAAIVGGGPAGLSAALTLGRAGRRVVLVDAGAARNAPAAHSHGYLTRDGAPPEEIRRLGREEAAGYGVVLRDGRVRDAERDGDGFRLALDGAGGLRADALRARVLVLATGVVDELPDIPGLAEAWGKTAVHCPYCHGHEHRGKATAVLGRGSATYGFARLLHGWTDDVTVVTNGPEDLDVEEERQLADEDVRILRAPIARLRAPGGRLEAVEFEGIPPLACGVLYLRPPQRPASPLAERLGAELRDGLVRVDHEGRTGVPGLFVVGDAANPVQEIATAAAGGARAAIAVNHDLICGPPEA